MTECLFCHHDNGQIVWQNMLCRVVLADEPDYPGFCRVIANTHVKEMTDLADALQLQIMRVVFVVEKAMRDILHPDKINLASLGNHVPHLHWHIIPRYLDDKHFPAPIWATASVERSPISHTSEVLAALAQHISATLTTDVVLAQL